MQLYDVDSVLYNYGMTLAPEGQGHNLRISEMEKNDIFR